MAKSGETFEGRPASSFGPADGGDNAVPTEPLSDSDGDATAAVEAALAESGMERAAVEGVPEDPFVIPEFDTPASQQGDEGGEGGKGDEGGKGGEGAEKPAAEGGKEGGGKEGDEPAPKADGETPPGTQPETTPASEPPPLTDAQAVEALNLTAEDLKEIAEDPSKAKIYKHMVRALNENQRKNAEVRKGHESDLDIMAKVRENPLEGLRALAAVAGIPVQFPGQDPKASPAADPNAPPQPPAPPEKTPLQLAEEQLSAALNPEGAKVLAPVLVKIAEAVARGMVKEQVDPIRQDLTKSQESIRLSEAQVAEAKLNTAVTNYGRQVVRNGGEWNDEIEGAVAKLIGKIAPGRDPVTGKPVTFHEYLDVLRSHVMLAKREESDRETQNAEKQAYLRRLQETHDTGGEPDPVRPTPTPSVLDREITADMTDSEAARLAIAQTIEEQRQGRA